MSLGASELRDDDVAGLRFFRRTRIISAVPIGFFGHGLGRADHVWLRWKESHRQCASDDTLTRARIRKPTGVVEPVVAERSENALERSSAGRGASSCGATDFSKINGTGAARVAQLQARFSFLWRLPMRMSIATVMLGSGVGRRTEDRSADCIEHRSPGIREEALSDSVQRCRQEVGAVCRVGCGDQRRVRSTDQAQQGDDEHDEALKPD